MCLSGYSHGTTGFYIFGHFQVKKRENGSIDLIIAVHKFQWKLEMKTTVKAEDIAYSEKYNVIKERYARVGGTLSNQIATELAEKMEQFKEFS